MWPISGKKAINRSQPLDDIDIGNIKPVLYRSYHNYTQWSIKKMLVMNEKVENHKTEKKIHIRKGKI